MYGKPAMTCFEYQVYLYCSEAFTYLLHFELLQSQHHNLSSSPTPHYRQPSPLCGSITTQSTVEYSNV